MQVVEQDPILTSIAICSTSCLRLFTIAFAFCSLVGCIIGILMEPVSKYYVGLSVCALICLLILITLCIPLFRGTYWVRDQNNEPVARISFIGHAHEIKTQRQLDDEKAEKLKQETSKNLTLQHNNIAVAVTAYGACQKDMLTPSPSEKIENMEISDSRSRASVMIVIQ